MELVRCYACDWIGFPEEAILDWDEELCPNCRTPLALLRTDTTCDFNDEQLENLWKFFEDVPMNPETEEIDEDFIGFPAGTHREEIWHWFDERYSKGVHALFGL